MLQSSGAMQICKEHADKARAKLGAGYETNTMVGKYRASAAIFADSKSARENNSNSNTILKALG